MSRVPHRFGSSMRTTGHVILLGVLIAVQQLWIRVRGVLRVTVGLVVLGVGTAYTRLAVWLSWRRTRRVEARR